MQIRALKTKIFREGDGLIAFIKKAIPRVKDGSILAITSKIVALSEGRVTYVEDKERIIQKESSWSVPARGGALTLKDGMLMWNAGVDESNAQGKLILLPKNSFASAQKLHRDLTTLYKVKCLGVVITDSRVMPLRAGVVGVALGYAGFKGLRDYRGKKDIFGRALKFTQTNVADCLATAAILSMGEGSERQPLAVIEDAPVKFTSRVSPREVRIAPERDMYRNLLRR